MKLRALLFFFTAVLACLALAAPALAQTEPRVEVTELAGFDPSLGKQYPLASFEWPSHRQFCAMVRYQTSGYAKRKGVTVFIALANRDGKVIYKYERELQQHAGPHELIVPEVFELAEMFGNQRYQLSCEIKLRGSNRATSAKEIVISGPAVPTVVIRDLKLLVPGTGEQLDSIGPGTPYELVGTVSVDGNTAGRLPQLVIWALMDNDVLTDDPWQPEPFSDQYWGIRQLDAADGKWRFAVSGRMPAQFIENSVSSQPFTFHIAVAFTPDTLTAELLKGTVLASGSGGLVSPDLDDRIITMEANWDWNLERMR
jgi:hypothetical protein